MSFEEGLVMVVTPGFTTVYEDGKRVLPILSSGETLGNSFPGRRFRVIAIHEQLLHDEIGKLTIPEGTSVTGLQAPD